jgi:hypothetical protein
MIDVDVDDALDIQLVDVDIEGCGNQPFRLDVDPNAEAVDSLAVDEKLRARSGVTTSRRGSLVAVSALSTSSLARR